MANMKKKTEQQNRIVCYTYCVCGIKMPYLRAFSVPILPMWVQSIPNHLAASCDFDESSAFF